MQNTTVKRERRGKRKAAIAAKIRGTGSRPRLVVFRSNAYLSAQLIDDTKGVTILSVRAQGKSIAQGQLLGKQIAELAAQKHIEMVVFDRGGYRYHGSIKALADAVREGGLQF